MPRFLRLPLLLLLGLAAGTAPASAQLDLDALDRLFDEEPRVEVNVQGALLSLVAEASREDEPEFAEMVRNLRGVFVRQYTLSSARQDLTSRLSGLARSLEQSGWQTLVRVRDEEEETFVYLRPSGDVLSGLVVMALNRNDDEATFVSIDGLIDPAEIGRLGSRFNVDALESVGEF